MTVRGNFGESFKWFLVGGGCLTIAWVLMFYVPYVPLKVFSLLMVSMAAFAFWQSYRTAKVYRMSHFLITAGIGFIFLAPVVAYPMATIILGFVDVVAEWAFEKRLNLLSESRKANFVLSSKLVWADLFHVLVGFGLIAWGWKLREETTTVVSITSGEEITQRIEKR